MDMNNPHPVTFIGRSKVTQVPPLPGGCGPPGLLVALANVPSPPGRHAKVCLETARQEASLGSFDVLVAGAHGDLGALLEAAASLRRRHPGLKVVLADCEEAPMVAGVMPLGVEVIVVTKEQSELGRALLLQQGGLLVGGSAGMAAFVAFTMAARIEEGASIAIMATNLSPSLLSI